MNQRLWCRGLIWLSILGPGFFLLYGSVNHFTATRQGVISLYWEFERVIPLVPWHFIPYLLLDFMFVASLFMCRSKDELDRHAKRLAVAIVAGVLCFLLWPLQFAFERPNMEGWVGELHKAFIEFDLPYNQAPSLHVIITYLTGMIFVRRLPKIRCWIMAWCALIIVSVLTTYQHHLIDIVTALPIIAFCLALYPDNPQRYQTAGRNGYHWVGYFYLGLTLAFLLLAAWMGYAGVLLAWPILACIIMAKAYLMRQPELLHKRVNGTQVYYVRWLLFPITLVQQCYKFSYHHKVDVLNEVLPNVWVARRLSSTTLVQYADQYNINTVIDVAPEFNAPKTPLHYYTLNWLDLSPVDVDALREAAALVAEGLRKGGVLIECKLGLQRSVLVALAYSVVTGTDKGAAPSKKVQQAYAQIKSKRFNAVLRKAQCAALESLCSS